MIQVASFSGSNALASPSIDSRSSIPRRSRPVPASWFSAPATRCGSAMHHLAFGRLLDDLDDQSEEDALEDRRQRTQVEPDREGARVPGQ